MASRKIFTPKGFTLLETLIVVGLFGVVGAAGMLMTLSTYRANTFDTQRDRLVATLLQARSLAMSGVCDGEGCVGGVPHGVHVERGSYTLFQGEEFSRDDQHNVSVELAAAQSQEVEIQFSARWATSTPATFVLSDEQGHDSTITVGSEGQLSWTP